MQTEKGYNHSGHEITILCWIGGISIAPAGFRVYSTLWGFFDPRFVSRVEWPCVVADLQDVLKDHCLLVFMLLYILNRDDVYMVRELKKWLYMTSHDGS